MEQTKELHAAVRAGFIVRGTSLNEWCRKNGITRQYADVVLLGKSDGPKAKELRYRITDAAGVVFAE